MTLIAGSIINKIPQLIGDILISRKLPLDGDVQIELPTTQQKMEILSPKAKVFPLELKQKIYIIKPNLCVALAGSTYNMKIFLKDAVDFFKYKEATLDNLREFTQPFENNEEIACTYLFLFASTVDNFQVGYKKFGKWKETHNQWIDSCIAAGSGAESFLKEIDSYRYKTGFGDGLNPDQSIVSMYGIISNLLAYERFSFDRIEDFWGAGFEMISYDGEKFIKVNEITHLIFETIVYKNLSHKNKLVVALNYKYYDDILVISSCEVAKPTRVYFVDNLQSSLDYFDKTKVPEFPNLNIGYISCSWIKRLDNNKVKLLRSNTIASNNKYRSKFQFKYNNNVLETVDIEREIEGDFFKNFRNLI